jgi:cell division protein FtsZ
MSIKLQLPKLTDLKPRITVLGVGGAGCNAINNMIAAGLEGCDFVVANTDAQALAASSAEHRLQLGINLTEGLGAGSRPEIGEAAAEEAIDDIRAHIAGSHMVFIAAGMGGGTGTGAAGVIARVAKELGILTVGIVTKPFHFEGARRMRIAEVGIAEVRKHVDTLIVIPNQNLFRIANEKTTFAEAFVLADQVLYSGVACIVDLIIKEGLINLDFADVRTVMSGMGSAVMGTGEASGDQRATIAAEEAIANPLLDDVSLRGARGLLLSITGGRNLTLYEVDEAASRVRQEVDPEANIIVGATFDETLGDRVRVSIVASGMMRTENGAAETARSASPRLDMRSRPPQPAQVAERPAPSFARASAEDDIKRRLSEAIEHVQESTRQAPPAMPPSNGSAQRQTWRAPGNVLIEEGFSQMAWPESAARAHDQEGDVAHDGSAGQFTPAPPTEIRRGARRMPDVDDFPPIGQREYRAKVGHVPSPPPPLPRVPNASTAQEAPRRGLLQRIINRARGLPEEETYSHYEEAEVAADPVVDSESWWQRDGDSSRDDVIDEQAPLPIVLNRLRK